MATMRWYRSRKNQALIVTTFVISIVYYLLLNDTLHTHQNLDITRRKSDLNITAESTSLKLALINTVPIVDERESIISYIENRLQEALKEDKGTGCNIPKLDPFNKEVTRFDKELPKVVCQGTDWVKCYLSKCGVVQSILDSTKDIVCTYKDILYKSDDVYTIGPGTDLYGAAEYVLKDSDHVKIRCTGKHINDILPSKWTGHGVGFRETVHPEPPPPGREDSLDVLIFGFDSTSKNGFIRRMPKSYKVLTEELHATVLNGYNIVGDGTPAALFPILTGKTELELPDVRKKLKNKGTLDSMPFIFKRLRDDGYRTAYFEDMPWIGTFQYRFNGFAKQPADHYLRDFYLEESSRGKKWGNGFNARYCVGDTPQYRLMINITEQFLKLPGKHFCFTFIADITHDDFNMISTADDDTASFLRRLKSDGVMEDTLLVFMGDHGPRYANVRSTIQGKFEERLPLMAIRLPEILKRSRPHALSNLKRNVDVLTTPHDIYATYLDVIGLKSFWNDYKIKGADLTRGMSLLEEIPKSRSCSEAGIEPHWCACLSWENVTATDAIYKRSAEAFVDYINSLTESVRDKCIPRTLTSIEWVMRQHANKKMLTFVNSDSDGYVGKYGSDPKITKENYQIKVTVGPGQGVYEASMTYLKLEDKFIVDSRDISRTNAYNNEPQCISATHPHLNMYCYCH